MYSLRIQFDSDLKIKKKAESTIINIWQQNYEVQAQFWKSTCLPLQAFPEIKIAIDKICRIVKKDCEDFLASDKQSGNKEAVERFKTFLTFFKALMSKWSQ